MASKVHDIFYGKIILFGEYGIIYNSMALTIPFTHFSGELSFDNRRDNNKYTDYDFAAASNRHLKSYAEKLKNTAPDKFLPFPLHLDDLVNDIDQGLYFESSIPQGFGLGSSGALVAALYHRYGISKIPRGKRIKKEDVLKLKEIFSRLENFFHGKSSGIDPLNSYLKHPLLIRSKTEIEIVGIPRGIFGEKSAIFLVNTGHPGKTEPMVKQFLDKCSNPDYFRVIINEYLPLINGCIESLLAGDMVFFFRHLRYLSQLQYRYFPEMIPEAFRKMWKYGLESDVFNLKLCGSGGGGYLLGFTRDYPAAQKYLLQQGADFILAYKA